MPLASEVRLMHSKSTQSHGVDVFVLVDDVLEEARSRNRELPRNGITDYT